MSVWTLPATRAYFFHPISPFVTGKGRALKKIQWPDVVIAQNGHQYEKNKRNPYFSFQIFKYTPHASTTWIRIKFFYSFISCYNIYYPISHHSVIENISTHPNFNCVYLSISVRFISVRFKRCHTKLPCCLNFSMLIFSGSRAKQNGGPTCRSYSKSWWLDFVHTKRSPRLGCSNLLTWAI